MILTKLQMQKTSHMECNVCLLHLVVYWQITNWPIFLIVSLICHALGHKIIIDMFGHKICYVATYDWQNDFYHNVI